MTDPFVAEVQLQLKPRFEILLRALADASDPICFAWFLDRHIALQAATDETAVLAEFIELSKAAFLGFHYDDETWGLADELLAVAEQISHTMTANDAH